MAAMTNDRAQLVKLIKDMELVLASARRAIKDMELVLASARRALKDMELVLDSARQAREESSGPAVERFGPKSCETCINFGSRRSGGVSIQTCLKFNSTPPPEFVKANDCSDYELDDIPF